MLKPSRPKILKLTPDATPRNPKTFPAQNPETHRGHPLRNPETLPAQNPETHPERSPTQS
jgi:hypothetical protein